MADEAQGGIELRLAADGLPDLNEAGAPPQPHCCATSSTPGGPTALRERLPGCRRLLWLAGAVGVLLIGMGALLKGRRAGGKDKHYLHQVFAALFAELYACSTLGVPQRSLMKPTRAVCM